MTDSLRIAEARREVARNKAALVETLHELQERLAPRHLASEAWEKAKVKGADMAEEAVDAVKRRPVAAGGAVAALLMFLARDPIKDGVVRMVDAMTSSKTEAKKTGPETAPARRRRKPAAPKRESAK